MSKELQLKKVMDLVRHGDIDCVKDRAVFYSNTRNRRAASAFCKKNPDHQFVTVTDLPLYRELAQTPLFGRNSPFTDEEKVDITALLSARFAQAASGNVILFYDKVSHRSTFFTIELPILLENIDVETINGVPKETWAHLVKPSILPRTGLVRPEELAFDLTRIIAHKTP